MFCNKRKKIAYVIGHRSSEEYRDRNLNIVINWLLKIKNKCLKLNIELLILVVEQDIIQKYKPPKNVEYILAYNDGYYNRGWGFNLGFRAFEYADYFYFADNDIVLNNDDIMNVFTKSFKYEAVNPYSEIYNSKNEMIIDSSFNCGNFNINSTNIEEKRSHICFSGGIMGISKKSMYIIAGWDERFRGRGWEDYAMTSKINLFLYDIHTFDVKGLHLWHPLEENSTREINYKLNIEYSQYEIEDYILQIDENYLLFGNIDKYKLNNIKKFKDGYKNRKKRYLNGFRKFKKIIKLVGYKHTDKMKNDILELTYLNLSEQHLCKNHEINKEEFNYDLNCDSSCNTVTCGNNCTVNSKVTCIIV
jgi:predicted glycosyltransferase involved in capsule biosynthesis